MATGENFMRISGNATKRLKQLQSDLIDAQNVAADYLRKTRYNDDDFSSLQYEKLWNKCLAIEHEIYHEKHVLEYGH